MLEMLKYLLEKGPELALGEVKSVGSMSTKGVAVELRILPDNYDVIALAVWPKGLVIVPAVGELMLAVFPDTQTETALAFGFVAGESRELHQRSENGGFCVGGIAGKKTNVSSNTRVNVGRGGDSEEDEPLVLGNVASEYLAAISQQLTTLNTHLSTLTASVTAIDAAVNSGAQAAALGTLTTQLGTQATEIGTEKAQYIDTDSSNILSQIAFTER